jgi:spoIIIJ-associated protein
MNHVEVEGRNIDEAIERALERLGVERDKAEIEIVSDATEGWFGIGGRKAKVRATLRTPLCLEAAAAERAARAGSLGGEPARAQSGARAPRSRQQARARAESAGPEQARATLQEIVRLMGTGATVDLVQDPDGPRLLIGGAESGVLIGRRGQTLDALEYLVNRVLAREEDRVGRIAVDSENYRERRRRSLEDLTHRLAERVRERGKPISLNPMSPRDRRTVHLALQGDLSLTTRSSGKGYFRKLSIIPANRHHRAARQESSG